MDTQEHIIKETSKLLQNVGPAAMTMDMVAKACGISKRTLYENFTDKRSLIKECLTQMHAKHNSELNDVFRTSQNCFEALFRTYIKIREYLTSGASKRAEEVARMYPDLFEDHKKKEGIIIGQLAKVLQKAQEEGHVIKLINTKIAAFIFLSSIRNINDNERISEYGLNRIEVFDGAFINFLRGVATISGIEFIDERMKNNNNTLQ